MLSLSDLHSALLARRTASPESSYTARLLSEGRGAVAQKLGEEAVEVVIAALQDDRRAIISESADLLYHWLVLMVECGISPDEVLAELERRQGTSGLEEKASRNLSQGD